MPGAGEFSIFGDNLGGGATPLTTRKGVLPTFRADKTIKGGSDPIGAATASQPVADQFFASKLGLFQKCIGIQWSSGRFLFAGGGGNYTPLPICLTGFSSGAGPLYVNAGVAAKKIIDSAPQVFAQGDEIIQQSLGLGTAVLTNAGSDGQRGGGAAYVGIHGRVKGQDIFVIGGYSLVNTEFTSEGTLVPLGVAVIFSSTDGGASWNQGSCPTLPRIDGVNKIIDGDPPITVSSTTEGCVTALAFDPQTETFFCTVTYVSDNNGWSCAFAESGDGSSFGGGFSGVSSIEVTPTSFPLPAWPADSLVNDATIPYFNTVKGTVSTASNVRYASVNAAGQTMSFGEKDEKTLGMSGSPGSYSFTGVSAPGLGDVQAISGCAKGLIVMLTGTSGEGNQSFLSVDGGASFSPFADEFNSADLNCQIGNVSVS